MKVAVTLYLPISPLVLKPSLFRNVLVKTDTAIFGLKKLQCKHGASPPNFVPIGVAAGMAAKSSTQK